eukprot:Hpha_TRINITY_DN14916_c0_g1::TRINITY_DN14916_c0_g1_i2::g.143052::m.143052/K20793/NAA50, NAT5; N-alpha-acetyltransferase 50
MAAKKEVHADPKTEETEVVVDPYKLGWGELKAPTKVDTVRMDAKRMWPLRLLHKKTLPVQYQETFYDKLYEHANPYSWLAHFMDVLVGDISCRKEPNQGRPGDRLYIMTFGVLEPYRGKGIGSHLLRQVMKDVYNSQKVNTIALHVQTTNERAQKFYSSFGFQNKGKVEGYYQQLKDADAYLLELEVPPKQ